MRFNRIHLVAFLLCLTFSGARVHASICESEYHKHALTEATGAPDTETIQSQSISSPVLFSPQNFDVLDYRVKLDLSAAPTLVLGPSTCRIKFVWTDTPDTFRFHLRGLHVDSAKYLHQNGATFDYVSAQILSRDSSSSAQFHYAVPALVTQRKGDTVALEVFYSGTMTAEPVVGGYSWGGVTKDQTDAVYSLGVGFHCNYVSCTQHWMPCFDLPSDKATLSVSAICAPSNLMVSNGLLTQDVLVTANQRLVEWTMKTPGATNLFTFAVGPYKKMDYGSSSSGVPEVVYAKPVDTTNVKVTFKHLPDMVQALESIYGPYPFEKVGYVITNNGSMEHQTMISFARGEFAYRDTLNKHVAHELAHQWFGDYVTPFDYRDAWLCESFATYSECAWLESVGGKARYLTDVKAKSDSYLNDVARSGGKYYEGVLPIYDFSRKLPSSNYPQTIYVKGAVVLSMLRHLIGDEKFYGALRDYLSRFAHKNATYDSLVQCVRNSVAPSLRDSVDDYFRQWVKGKGWPVLDIQCLKVRRDDRWQASLHIKQVQADSLGVYTWFPLELAMRDDSGRVVYRTLTINGASQDIFLDSVNNIQSISVNGGKTVHALVQLAKAPVVTDLPDELETEQDAEVYPNPCSEILWLRLRGGVPAHCEIVDMLGNTILSDRMISPTSTLESFDTSTLAQGSYLLKLSSAAGSISFGFRVIR